MYWVYILSSRNNKILYIGLTNYIQRRLHEHKNKLLDGFTKKYNIYKLVYLEEYSSIHEANQREKQLKKWNRAWKDKIIEKENPHWQDLSDELFDGTAP